MVAVLASGADSAGDKQLEPGQKKERSTPLICPASPIRMNTFANCFSFACERAGKINGVEVANCFCPIGESLTGTVVNPGTESLRRLAKAMRTSVPNFPWAGHSRRIPISLQLSAGPTGALASGQRG